MYKLMKDREIIKRGEGCLGVLSIIIASIASLLIPYLNKIVIDSIVEDIQTLNVQNILAIVAILILSQAIIFYFARYRLREYYVRFQRKLTLRIFKKSLEMNVSDYQDEDPGKIHNLYYSDSYNIAASLLNYRILMPGTLLEILITLILLLNIDIRLTSLACISIPVYILIVVWNSKIRAKLNESCISSNDQLVKDINNFKENIISIKQMKNNDYFLSKFAESQENNYLAHKNYYFGFELGERLPSLIQLITPIVMLWLGSIKVKTGAITFGTMFMFSQYIGGLFQPVTNFFSIITEAKSVKPFYTRYEDFLYKRTDSDEIYNSLFKPQDDFIKVENANIRSRAGDELYNANFNLPKRGLYLLKGPNGSGKSTIIKMIAGIFTCQDTLGSISIAEEYKNDISILQYPLFFFSGSVEENILVGGKKLNNKLRELFTIPELDKDIVVSPLNLSNGEAQKISILRILMEDRNCLLLDEPTSSLEKEAILSLTNYLERESKNKLIIVISHDEYMNNIADGVLEIVGDKLMMQANG